MDCALLKTASWSAKGRLFWEKCAATRCKFEPIPLRPTMRVLSLHQPFAQRVVRGVKRVEVHNWTTEFDPRRGNSASD